MDSLMRTPPAKMQAPPPETQPDYYSRALALWPRLEHARLGRARRDPTRVAALISRRTTLSRESILILLGAPPEADQEHPAEN